MGVLGWSAKLYVGSVGGTGREVKPSLLRHMLFDLVF